MSCGYENLAHAEQGRKSTNDQSCVNVFIIAKVQTMKKHMTVKSKGTAKQQHHERLQCPDVL